MPNYTPLSVCRTAHLSIHSLKASWLLPNFVNYEQSCYKNPSEDFCVGTHFQLIGINTKEYNCWIIWFEKCVYFYKKLPSYLPVVVAFCIPTSSERYHYSISSSVKFSSPSSRHSNSHVAILPCCFNLQFPGDMIWNIILYTHLWSAYLLLWNVRSVLLPIFKFSRSFSYCES